MKIIYKYAIQALGFEYTEVDVPEGEVVHVDIKHGICTVWILKEKDEIATMRLRMIPTGKEFDDTHLSHVGSAVSPTYCWHVFKVY